MPMPPLSQATIRRVLYVTRRALLDLSQDMADPAGTTACPQTPTKRRPDGRPAAAQALTRTAPPMCR